MMLEGKRLLITGVATQHSIAYAVARQAQESGAEIMLTSFGRMRSMTERAARSLPRPARVVELDVSQAADFEALPGVVEDELGSLDGALHAVAWAPPDAFGGRFLSTPVESVTSAMTVSALSLRALATALLPIFAGNGGGSLVGLDFDAARAWPMYDWMGVCKAALESIARYLARDLGDDRVRVNLVAAGPLATPSAGGIDGFSELTGHWGEQAPLGWDRQNPLPVARAVCFLLSDWAEAITGEILHVDGGYHAMAAPRPPAPHG